MGRPQIVIPVPRWQQIADWLRAEILSGRYPAGQPLPSEETLAGEFGVSRPTVRQGIAALAAEGLLTVRRPYGTIVRDPHARPAHTEHRALRRDQDGYRDADSDRWTDTDPPVFVRVDATAAYADLLSIPVGQPLLTREGAQHSTDGRRRLVRLLVPFSVATDLNTPWADQAQLPPAGQLYAWFADHGHPPRFTEYVRARMPLGDEVAMLQTRPGVPLLVIARVAAHNTQPLALEEIRSPADTTEAAYPLPVTGTPTRRARTSR